VVERTKAPGYFGKGTRDLSHQGERKSKFTHQGAARGASTGGGEKKAALTHLVSKRSTTKSWRRDSAGSVGRLKTKRG